MKKKCLGCGKIFEDKISICQDCFKTIEATRSQLDYFPRGFRKKPLLVTRKILSLCVIFSIICSVFLFSFPVSLVLLRRYPIFLFTGIYLPVILLFVVGIYLGNLLNKVFAKKFIKTWLDKTWYSFSTMSGRYIKYWLSAILPFFTLLFIFPVVFYILIKLFLLPEIKSIFKIYLFLGLNLGLHAFSLAFPLGVCIASYFSLDWVQKLSK